MNDLLATRLMIPTLRAGLVRRCGPGTFLITALIIRI